jgi:transcription antitermination factor NusG
MPPSPVRAVRARVVIEKGVTVLVLAGPFDGKVGVVQELDGKGAARVTLGTLSAWIPTTDLTQEAQGRERPPFKSSHRKPVR